MKKKLKAKMLDLIGDDVRKWAEDLIDLRSHHGR